MNSSENREIKFEFIVKAKIADKEIHRIDFTFDNIEKSDFSLYDFMYERLESISAEYCGCSISEGNPHCDCDGGGWDGDWEIISRRQYTGRKDKNNVEIFNGDIVVINDTDFEDDNDPTPWEIKKMHGTFVLFYSEQDYYYLDKNIDSFLHSFPDSWEIEVIGNIFENPELRNKNHELIKTQ